jgi:hypothetical protein
MLMAYLRVLEANGWKRVLVDSPAGVDVTFAHGPAQFQWVIIAHSMSAGNWLRTNAPAGTLTADGPDDPTWAVVTHLQLLALIENAKRFKFVVEMARDKKPGALQKLGVLAQKLVVLGVALFVAYIGYSAFTDWYHGYLTNRCVQELSTDVVTESCTNLWHRVQRGR